ncbi:MAG: ATP-binding protein [Lachnospiraceae bacterium]|nr:ATP-binding protein [Lachnospiraceae bacterium]
MKPVKKHSVIWILIAASLMFLSLSELLGWLYQHDNKYAAGPPYGEDGVLTCTAEDLGRPLFLIDGWEFYPDAAYTPEDFARNRTVAPSYTFIGQYSSYAFTHKDSLFAVSPFGVATYRLRVRMNGDPVAVSLKIPEVFTNYQLWINGTPAKVVSAQTDVILDQELELVWVVENHSHYYSGLYYPPALGTPAAISRIDFLRTLFYGVLCISTLTLAVFSLVLWMTPGREPLFFHFGLFCLFFCLSCLHPLLWRLGRNSTLSYVVEDTARLAVLSEAIWISMLASGLTEYRHLRYTMRILLPVVCAICASFVAFIIPSSGLLINGYGAFIEACYLAGWLLICACAAYSIYWHRTEFWFILSGAVSLGAGFLVNILNNNRFEPICGGWQTEYSGFLMVLSFGGLMVWKNHSVLQLNQVLMTQMEELVNERTSELTAVLNERKNFFSDMAHNLKAPIAAVHGFISLIREGNLYLDEELDSYLTQIELENHEIGQRVSSLSALNAYDRISSPVTLISINTLMRRVQENNEPDACVMGIYLATGLLEDERICVRGQWEKLLILFENLIYNAISFTPENGQITVTPSLLPDIQTGASAKTRTVRILVSDTGCGIAPEHLPHIFERFYTGRGESGGSGLGLYIAKMVVEEMGGSIQAATRTNDSGEACGAVFEIHLPAIVSITPLSANKA